MKRELFESKRNFGGKKGTFSKGEVKREAPDRFFPLFSEVKYSPTEPRGRSRRDFSRLKRRNQTFISRRDDLNGVGGEMRRPPMGIIRRDDLNGVGGEMRRPPMGIIRRDDLSEVSGSKRP